MHCAHFAAQQSPAPGSRELTTTTIIWDELSVLQAVQRLAVLSKLYPRCVQTSPFVPEPLSHPHPVKQPMHYEIMTIQYRTACEREEVALASVLSVLRRRLPSSSRP